MVRMSTIDLSRRAALAAALLAQLPKSQGAWQLEPACARNFEILIDGLRTGDAVSVELGALFRDALTHPHEMTTQVMHGLLIAVCGYAAESGNAALSLEHRIRGMTARQYESLLEYVDAHLSSSLSLADLATTSTLTVAHLSRALKRATGETPKRWLQQRRVNHAKQLLVRNNGSLREIAIACGFSSQSHLTRVFVKLTGTTPRAWQASRRIPAQSRTKTAGMGVNVPRGRTPIRSLSR